MREIKFRYIYQHEETGRITTRIFDFETISKGHAFISISKGYPVVAKNQFTGLHDKNATPIYEGDILQIDEEPTLSSKKYYPKTYMFLDRYIVKYSIDEGAFYIHSYKGVMLWSLKTHLETKKNARVIGNIYENPKELNASVPQT